MNSKALYAIVTVVLITFAVHPGNAGAGADTAPAHKLTSALKHQESPVRPEDHDTPGAVSNLAYTDLTSWVTFNQSYFFVYLDQDSGFNHGFPSGKFSMNDAALVDEDTGCVDDPMDTDTGCYPPNNMMVLDQIHRTVLRVTFPPESGDQLTGLNIEEPENWGMLVANGMCEVTTSCTPYDLTGATSIEFDARSPDGITVQFGVGSLPADGCSSAPMVLPPSATYTHISLTLGPPMLSCTPVLTSANVLFTVVTNAGQAPLGGTVLLDNIQFTPVPSRAGQGTETLSLPVDVQTFGVVPQPSNCTPPCMATSFPPDQVNRNPASIYEASLTILSLLDRGQADDLTNAQEIANALDYALAHENQGDPIPLAPDGSAGLHNAYSDGDIGLLNDQTGAGMGKAKQVRLAGFTVPVPGGTPTFDLVLDGATGGNNAFVVIALLAAYKQFGTVAYLNDAITISDWIVGNLQDATGTGYDGYYLGYPDMGMMKILMTSKSTENNPDIFAAFTLLSQVETSLGNSSAAAQWAGNAALAGNFVLAMYDSANGRFNAGTVLAGTMQGSGVCPTGAIKGKDQINVCDFLDADSFTTLAMAGSQAFGAAIDWAQPVNYVLTLMMPPPVMSFTQIITANSLPFSGFDLVPALSATGIAWEFTGQMVETCSYTDAIAKGNFQSCVTDYFAQIAAAQSLAPFTDKLGIVAATVNGENDPPNNMPPLMECLMTPFQCIPERVGLAATNWAIYADQEFNPLSLPPVTLSPTSLTFGVQFVGTSSPQQTITLTNAGSAALTLDKVSITGTDPSDFIPANHCPGSIPAGTSCSIGVSFKPAGIGARTANLTLADSAYNSPQTVSLAGTGTGPIVTLSPTSLTFATQLIGTSSASQTVTLTNTGTASLTLDKVATTGTDPSDFIPANHCGGTITAGSSCTIGVTFKPTASGTRSANLTLTDSATNSPQNVPLTGTGTSSGPIVTLSPTSLTFTSQDVGTSSAAQAVTLTNTGGATLTLDSVTITGTDPSDFISANHCGGSISAGSSCIIDVTFKPIASGTRSADLTLKDSATNSPQNVPLSGTGIAAPVVTLSPTSLTFGVQAVGTSSAEKAVTLTNTGDASLTLDKVTITGTDPSDFIPANHCGGTITAGSSCTIDVTFKPTESGTRSADLTLTDSATNSPQLVPLTGTGK